MHRPRFGNLHCRRSSRISPSFHNRDRQVVGINKGDGELESLQSKQFSFVQLPRSSSVPSDTTSPGGHLNSKCACSAEPRFKCCPIHLPASDLVPFSEEKVEEASVQYSRKILMARYEQ